MVSDKDRRNELDMDLRVRERLLASGTLSGTTIQEYLAGLPDMEAQSEVIPIDQPAMGAGSPAARAEPMLGNDRSE